MALYRIQVTLRTTSGILNDFPTNTWHIDADDLTALDGALDVLESSYDDYLRPRYPVTINQNGHEMVCYRISDPEPRAPVLTRAWNFSSGITGNPLPSEVAMCLSYQGEKASGVPQSRRRGRIYIGPLNVGTLHTDGRPAAAAITSLVDAGENLLQASKAAPNWKWAVYSRVNGSGVSAENGWVDNAFDTQRRRGVEASARTTFV